MPFGGLKVKGSSLNILPDRTCWNSSETREVNQRLPGFKMNIICFRLSPLVTNILFFSIVCILNLHLKVSTTKLYLILNCIVDHIFWPLLFFNEHISYLTYLFFKLLVADKAPYIHQPLIYFVAGQVVFSRFFRAFFTESSCLLCLAVR